MVLSVDHSVSRLGQTVYGTDGLNAIVFDINRCVAKFIASVIERGDGVGVVDQQGGHGNDFARRN
jgi:hypothetical protein